MISVVLAPQRQSLLFSVLTSCSFTVTLYSHIFISNLYNQRQSINMSGIPTMGWQSVPRALCFLVLGSLLLAGRVQGSRSPRRSGTGKASSSRGSSQSLGAAGRVRDTHQRSGSRSRSAKGKSSARSPGPATADGAAAVVGAPTRLDGHDFAAARTGAADHILPRTDASSSTLDLPEEVWAGVAPFVFENKFVLHNVFDAFASGRWPKREIDVSWRAFYNLLRQRPHPPMPIVDLSKLNRQFQRTFMQATGQTQNTMQRTSMVPVGHPYGLAAQLVCYGAAGTNNCGYSAAIAEPPAVTQLDAPLRHFLKLLEDALTQDGMREVEEGGIDVFNYNKHGAHVHIGFFEPVAKVYIGFFEPQGGFLLITADNVPLSEEEQSQLGPWQLSLDTRKRKREIEATLSNGLEVFAVVEEVWESGPRDPSSSEHQRLFNFNLLLLVS
ncbi:unnamed protein product [Amoebophrya sp. A120]|nr:unnamed protein product [Amoebophrya sp. A120]|eukprot:GSA120T00013051001.1